MLFRSELLLQQNLPGQSLARQRLARFGAGKAAAESKPEPGP